MLETLGDISKEGLRLMLRPLARFWLRHSHTLQDFIDIAKIVFVEVAAEEIQKTSEKVNVSRISVMTGVHRKDVTKIYKENEGPKRHQVHILTRVIGQWEQDKRFTTKGGKPRVLSVDGDEGSFRALVQAVSKNINPGTVLFELKRIGSVEETPRGIRLTRRAHRPADSGGLTRGFELLSRDVEALISAVEENISSEGASPNLHVHTEYDNIFINKLPQIREWLWEEGRAFHKKARAYLSQFDQDVSPQAGSEAGGRVVVSAFSLTADE